ncbi:SusC/RagA family TonB-linked outer membrane protein [Mucilaginibacter sp. PPCGB 2223]|nr:SusC/RagA family TonB-linked outer membrane protein [Mucilaginibacter sp. PPCGB 2223]
MLYRVISDRIVLNVNPQYLEAKRIEAENIAKAEAAINVFTVKGQVTDDNGGLPGVNVRLKGSQATGAVTDINGNYTIAIPDGTGTLVFSFVGYADQEVAVGGRSVVNVRLEPNAKSLNEVVVIGYGTQKASNVTGAVATMKNENLDERAITRVDQALVGQLAGVTVKQTTGVPGKAFSVQVRGSGSISAGNEPLYVIDGFPLTTNSSNVSSGSFSTGNPLDNINPNDIENIEVLKDAAAAAIYGSRASNGVVLITTKRGKTGKPQISFNNYVGYNAAAKHLNMLNGDEWIDRATEIINATYVAKAGAFGATANDDANTRRAKLTLAGVPLSGTQVSAGYMPDPRWSIPGHPGLEYVDWQKAIERNGFMQNSEISAQGGTENVTYFVSGNYANQDGFVMALGYKQYSARANVEINASKKLKFGLNLAPTYSITQDPGVEGKDNIFHQALSMSPVQEDTVGVLANIGKNAQYVWSNTTNSPVGKLMYNVGTTKRYRTLGTVYGEYEIAKGLVFRSSVNLDYTSSSSNSYVPYITTGSQASRTFTGSNNLLSANSGSYSNYTRQTFVNENTLNYSTTIAKNHSLNVLLGQSYNLDRFDQSSLKSSGGYTSAVIQTLNAAAAITGSTTSTQSVLESYFARVQYGFKDKYLLSASIRSDGSSRFGVNNQFGVFPSASVAWRVIQESFMKSVPNISDLKLRFSYGVNGNNNIGDYDLPTLASAGYVFGSTQAAVIGQTPANIYNPDLKWERSQTYDGGLDFGIFNNRITGSIDYYNKLSTQLLLNVQTLEVTGFQSYLTNVGSVRNIGEELEITTRNTVGSFGWNTTFNVSHNTNKILALAPGQTQIIVPNGFNVSDQILRVGQPLNSIYVLKYNGFLTAADIAAHYPTYGPAGAEQPGDPKFEDTNGDGSITEADKQIVGHPNPDYTFGLTNTFRFKGFDLSILVQGQTGGTIYSELARALSRPGQGFTDNEPETFNNRWRSESNTGDGRFGKAYSTYNSPIAATADAVYSTNYIRVRDITLGYNLKRLIKTPVIKNARVYITAENFFGADKYTNGLNPDAANTTVSSNGNYPEAGDYGGLPLAKSLIFGINFTF